jgi:hypothetical protein
VTYNGECLRPAKRRRFHPSAVVSFVGEDPFNEPMLTVRDTLMVSTLWLPNERTYTSM